MTVLTVAEVNRTYDLVVFDGAVATGEAQLSMQLAADGQGGKVCTGIQKLAQAFLVELLTEKGSVLYDPDAGTVFMIEARQGYFRTPTDVASAFNRSVMDIKAKFSALERATDPLDEQFSDADILSIIVQGDRVTLRIQLWSKALETRPIVLPVTLTP